MLFRHHFTRPLRERREKYLKPNVKEIKHRILHSEAHEVTDGECLHLIVFLMLLQEDDLKVLMNRVMKEGLEGLVMKDKGGVYEPGKRHWLKMKKDYLADVSD